MHRSSSLNPLNTNAVVTSSTYCPIVVATVDNIWNFLGCVSVYSTYWTPALINIPCCSWWPSGWSAHCTDDSVSLSGGCWLLFCTATALLRPVVQVMLTISTRPVMHTSRRQGRWVWLPWPTKTLFVMLVGHAEQFKAHLSQFFCGFRQLLRCLDVEIWWFLWFIMNGLSIGVHPMGIHQHTLKGSRDTLNSNPRNWYSLRAIIRLLVTQQ